jgi:hypothetical protein
MPPRPMTTLASNAMIADAVTAPDLPTFSI